ncbi:MAG: iron-sulfur cluster biosynthesis family protein [Bacteroidota bacterium]
MFEHSIPVTFSESAKKEIKHTIEKKNIPEEYGLRVGVRGGMACGGGGMSHILGFDKKKTGDHEFELDGIPVYIQKKDTMYLIGLEVDFYEGSDARGFTFVNPEGEKEEKD